MQSLWNISNVQYSYTIFEHDQKMPKDAFKPVVEEILKSLAKVGDDGGLRRFYNKLEETWPLRFTNEDAKATLRHWTNWNSMWKISESIESCS
jgi:hypothetical protein